MGEHIRDNLVTLGQDWPVWDRVFTVNPLVLIGTREGMVNTTSPPSIWRFPWAGRTTSGSSAPRVTRPTTTPGARVSSPSAIRSQRRSSYEPGGITERGRWFKAQPVRATDVPGE